MRRAMFVACVALCAACTTTGEKMQDMNQATQEKIMEKTITFEPGKVYEVTAIWPREGKVEQLGAYFGEVFPIAASRYGVKPLFNLEPVNTYAGDFAAPMMFVNEWPSLERFQAFLADPEVVQKIPRRDDAVTRLVVTQYEVPEAKTVTLKEGDVIEFAGMWIKPGQEAELQAYYQEVFPVAMRHGVKPITPLSAVMAYRGDFEPTRAGLNWWGRLENFESFAKEAAPMFPRRDAALTRLEVTHARVRFEGGEG